MTRKIKLLTIEQIIVMHQEVVAETGGSQGIRDRGAIESAVAQPQMSFGGQELYPTLTEKAAALSYSLVSNHPFVDGNKRIGWVTLHTLLRLNGHRVRTSQDQAERIVLSLAAGELSREDWTTWVTNHTEKIA